MQASKVIGMIVLAIGILLLITGLFWMILVGSFAGTILLFSSIVVNSVGITVLRHR